VINTTISWSHPLYTI